MLLKDGGDAGRRWERDWDDFLVDDDEWHLYAGQVKHDCVCQHQCTVWIIVGVGIMLV